MMTVLEGCSTEEQRSAVRFCELKGSVQMIFINKCFLFKVGSVCRVKKSGKSFADVEEVKTELPKWLRQQSKHFIAAGVDALIKRWDKCTSVGGGYVEKYFVKVRILFVSICDLFTEELY
jgi:hypothetical protein